MDRPDISKLKRNRPIYFQVGMILSLSFVILAFNWSVHPKDLGPVDIEAIDEPAVHIQRTLQRERPLPPPQLLEAKTVKEILTDPIFTEEPEPKMVDTAIQTIKLTGPEPVFDGPSYPVAPKYVPVKPKIEEPEAPLIIVEKMPRFPGCEEVTMTKEERTTCANSQLLSFLSKNVSYPKLAREANIEGTVVISFVVEKDGQISKAEIRRDIGGGCGREALRVVNQMPKWIPGSQQGQKVRVMFNLPVRFKLQK
jgi:protein TonB